MKKKICVAIIFALFIVFVEMFIDSSSEGSKIMTAELSKYRKGVNVLSINNIIVANKKYSLPKDYSPQESSEARDAFYKMNKDAQKSGLNLKAFSTYRSYEYQDRLFKSYVKEHGEKEANRFSAKPGESEHQTGLAFDKEMTSLVGQIKSSTIQKKLSGCMKMHINMVLYLDIQKVKSI